MTAGAVPLVTTEVRAADGVTRTGQRSFLAPGDHGR
jgi:hypothetical protein